MSLRRFIGKLTSPIFVPLRRFIVWGDKTFGTCNYTLGLNERYSLGVSEEEQPMDGWCIMGLILLFGLGCGEWGENYD